jgi:hypothetical protein
MPQVLRPVGGGDLVLDQLVDGLGVRNAQQRLGKAHQRHAFLGGKAVLVEEGLHRPVTAARPQVADQLRRLRRNRLARLGRETRLLRQVVHRFGLVGQVVGADGFAEIGCGTVAGHGTASLPFEDPSVALAED